jgi:hypothetical protein
MSKDVPGLKDICQHFTVRTYFIPHCLNEQLFIEKIVLISPWDKTRTFILYALKYLKQIFILKQIKLLT